MLTFDATTAPHIFARGEYVIIRRDLDIAEAKYAFEKLSAGTSSNLVQTGNAQIAVLQTAIAGWSINRKRRNLDGSISTMPLPYRKENIPQLRRAVFEYVFEQIRLNNPTGFSQAAEFGALFGSTQKRKRGS